ncbi:unnamed protein product [Dracunculus medinensis]|uniref:Reverse transcriptase n=1 Tax=Dracunculus medinensis TaxID=318479 RepID=A0A0N4U7Q2_DRAME|nr:unnamed protein product [Dracunculus medinensis]
MKKKGELERKFGEKLRKLIDLKRNYVKFLGYSECKTKITARLMMADNPLPKIWEKLLRLGFQRYSRGSLDDEHCNRFMPIR